MKIIDGFESWDEIDLLAGLILGEARGEPRVGRIAVGLTVRTRVEHPRWWGGSWREVILRCAEIKQGKIEAQFSCWTDHNVDYVRKVREWKSDAWKQAIDDAEYVYMGDAIDFLGKPTHYHSVKVFPDWASGMKRLKQIGNHVFYRDEKEAGI